MNIIQVPDNVYTSDDDWWFIYNETTENIIVLPMQCSGITSSPYTMAIGSSLEECQEYIEQNKLKKNVDVSPVLDII